MLAVVGCVVLMLWPAAQLQLPERDPLPPRFAAILTTYRDGDLWAAMTALDATRKNDLDEALEALWRPGALTRDQWVGRIRAALALLTEAGFVKTQKGAGRLGQSYLHSARSIARTLVRLAGARREGLREDDRLFARDWYLLIVSFRHGAAEPAWSRAYLAEARGLFPDDAEVLEVSGADHEMVSAVAKGFLARMDTSGVTNGETPLNPQYELERAEHFLRRAVAVAPDMAEARLRLGRVLSRRGDNAGAARELQAALALTRQDELRYMAFTFLGLVATAERDFEAADGYYVEALRIFPDTQSAMIGRSEAAYLRGNGRVAAEIVLSVLGHSAKEDPWWLYLVGDWWHLEARLMRMRKQVQRP